MLKVAVTALVKIREEADKQIKAIQAACPHSELTKGRHSISIGQPAVCLQCHAALLIQKDGQILPY